MRYLICLFGFVLVLANTLSAETIKCGAIVPLSGPYMSVGTSIKNSIQLADAELDRTNKIEFLFEDDQFTPKLTVTAANKLVVHDRVKCLILFGSSTSLAAAGISERAKVPSIAIAISPQVAEGRAYVVRHYVPMNVQVDKILAEISARGYKRIALITSVQDAALSLREEFSRRFNGKILADYQVLPSDLDFRTIASKLMELKPDGVMLNLIPPQTSLGGIQLRQAGLESEFFSGQFLGNLTEIRASKGALAGSWFVASDDSLAADYYRKYQASFGELPELEGANAYDVAKIFIEAAGSSDINLALHAAHDFAGILGKYGISGSTFVVPAAVRIVTAEGFKTPE